ncbi:uncharacterized protein LOC100904030 [Galendromus occidentalis]|uniref:riboflavin kinase n=1 Tax=Galendromus occidentalis TaxID=34638 RepID=A0AAJ6VX58_9ACAR|nr:uncharacterized protein LOC100904030 [Galendromus occidentalis]
MVLPVYLRGKVVHGFGRGSRDLGCPTANIDPKDVDVQLPTNFEFGIYYGWAKLVDGPENDSTELQPMVANVGLCPFYKNEKPSVEIHLIHEFPEDFYGATLKVLFLGYLRGEKNFDSVNELISQIRKDIADSKEALTAQDCSKYRSDPFFDWIESLTMLPVLLEGKVVRGFGRGRQLGVPTANLEADSVAQQLPKNFPRGIYFGWAQITADESEFLIYDPVPMVSSIGINPFFKNRNLTVEIHLLPGVHQTIPRCFYGCTLRVLLTGFLRDERDFSSTVSLVDAIRQDIRAAEQELSHEQQVRLRDTYFSEARQTLSDLSPAITLVYIISFYDKDVVPRTVKEQCGPVEVYTVKSKNVHHAGDNSLSS